jgi:large subunit ribosomal protein L23
VTKDPRDIIIAPIVSEKSYSLLDQNVYTFSIQRVVSTTASVVHPEGTVSQ